MIGAMLCIFKSLRRKYAIFSSTGRKNNSKLFYFYFLIIRDYSLRFNTEMDQILEKLVALQQRDCSLVTGNCTAIISKQIYFNTF